MSNSNKNLPLTPGMEKLMSDLEKIVSNPVVEAAYNDAITNVEPILYNGESNPWLGQPISYFVDYFRDWFTFLPTPVGGLGKIVPFTYFYSDNEIAFNFLNHFESRQGDAPYTKEIFNWTVEFIKERGRFMDSPESLKYIEEWIHYPATKIDDFIVPPGGYKSFNEFFIRELKPSANARPISQPDEDNILVASADSEINFIESALTLETRLDVKGRQINVKDLLNNSSYAKYFEGGTAVSAVLLPGSYHRYHTPVTGDIVESMEVPGIYNGIVDGEDWFNNYNIGESTTDFSIFEDFHRGYFVIKTKEYGHVGVIPVGLNTISALSPSLVNNKSTMVPPGGTPVAVKKGDELGHFAYGGSLNILLFEPDVLSAMSVIQGQRIGTMSKKAPEEKQKKVSVSSFAATNPQVAVRHSVRELQNMYDNGNRRPLEDLVRAWKGIKELPADDPRSFFVLGGYHGEPFIGPGATDPHFWGGYCNHGNVLFPTWHRAYVKKVEEALQSIVPGVMMAYWDETSNESYSQGIPSVLTDDKFILDGIAIENPLKSFVFPVTVTDNVMGQVNLYTKPAGYETVRYPLSGLVGTPEAAAKSAEHNSQFPDYNQNVELLNQNVKAWLKGDNVSPSDPNPTKDGIYWQFANCLNAPNYTAFSNTTSGAAWNKQNPGSKVTPLEEPHNDVHLAVGGFDVPTQGEFGQIAGANGDMGENNTAGLDPIFFFHHCNVDRMFWVWQQQNGYTDEFEIISNYPGTNSNDSQGPTPGVPPNTELTMDSLLTPFTKPDSNYYTSRDCINIETQMGFTYSHGSLSYHQPLMVKASEAMSTQKLEVSGINRELLRGSFIIAAFAKVGNQEIYLGKHSVLSRWNVAECANCQKHLEVEAHFDLDKLTPEQVKKAKFSIKISSREKIDMKNLSYKLNVVD